MTCTWNKQHKWVNCSCDNCLLQVMLLITHKWKLLEIFHTNEVIKIVYILYVDWLKIKSYTFCSIISYAIVHIFCMIAIGFFRFFFIREIAHNVYTTLKSISVCTYIFSMLIFFSLMINVSIAWARN